MTGRIEKLQSEFDISVRWRAFPLHPETPDEGRLLEDLFRTSPEKIAAIIEHLRATAEQLGLPLGTRTRTYNSRLAQELGLWAEDQAKGDAFHRAAFHAYFVDGKNLAKLPVLLELARGADLAEEEAKLVVENRTYRRKVDADWEYSRFHGITAVPTFLMGRHRLVGAQSYEALAELVTLYGAVGKKQAGRPPSLHGRQE